MSRTGAGCAASVSDCVSVRNSGCHSWSWGFAPINDSICVCSTVPSLFKTWLDKVATQENTTQHKLLRSPSKESVTVNDCYILNPPANGLAVIK